MSEQGIRKTWMNTEETAIRMYGHTDEAFIQAEDSGVIGSVTDWR